jgi:hypothetical protein
MRFVLLHLPLAIVSAAVYFACSFGASPAQAGPVYMFLVVDPATTAGAGVASSDGFSVNSNRSGPGTWHLYAVDDLADSYGIRSFNVKLNPGEGGTIPIVTNRSPLTSWDDDPTFGSGTGPFCTGFNDIRTNANTSISGAQGVLNNAPIGGFGISASNFQQSTPGQSFSGTTNGQWGTYADAFTSGYLGNTGEMRNALFLGEGTYTGAAPTVDVSTSSDSGVNYWADAGLNRSTSALELSSSNPFACPDCVNNHDPFLVSRRPVAAPEPPAAPILSSPPPHPIVTLVEPKAPPVTTARPDHPPIITPPNDPIDEMPPSDQDGMYTYWPPVDSSITPFWPLQWLLIDRIAFDEFRPDGLSNIDVVDRAATDHDGYATSDGAFASVAHTFPTNVDGTTRFQTFPFKTMAYGAAAYQQSLDIAGQVSDSIPAPEPAMLALVGLAAVGFCGLMSRRRS